jgi:phage-related baseplate assembly protein
LFRSRIRLAVAIALAAGSVALSAMPGYAQQGKQKQDDVRVRGQAACGGDVDKLCAKLKGQADPIVLQCLQQAKADLGDSCRKFLTEVGQLN